MDRGCWIDPQQIVEEHRLGTLLREIPRQQMSVIQQIEDLIRIGYRVLGRDHRHVLGRTLLLTHRIDACANRHAYWRGL
ncbi:MAG: hypothetical protein ACI9UA_000207 [Pseudoalteromonas tetraodonis]